MKMGTKIKSKNIKGGKARGNTNGFQLKTFLADAAKLADKLKIRKGLGDRLRNFANSVGDDPGNLYMDALVAELEPRVAAKGGSQ